MYPAHDDHPAIDVLVIARRNREQARDLAARAWELLSRACALERQARLIEQRVRDHLCSDLCEG